MNQISTAMTLSDLDEMDPNEGVVSRPMQPILTLADVLMEAERWSELSGTVREVLKSYIRAAGFIAASSRARAGGRTNKVRRADVLLSTIPSDVEWLNDHLFTYPAAVHGLTKIMHSKSIGGLRRVLRRFGLLEPRVPAPPAPASDWFRFLESLPDQAHCRIALNGFASWCHFNDIGPDRVSGEVLEAFERFVRTRRLQGDIPQLIRSVRKAWRKAAEYPPNGPKDLLTASRRREPYMVRLTAFPAQFQDEIAALEGRLSGANRRGPFRGDGPRRRLRPRSIEMRLYSLRQAASALVQLGRDPATVLSLDDLVDEAAFEAALYFFWQRGMAARTTPEERAAGLEPSPELGVTAQTGLIASALMMVAKHHCKLSEDKLLRLRSMASDMTPRVQAQLSQKNQDRLRQFDDPLTRAKLLHLPKKLMELAEEGTARPGRAARLARVATAIELLLHIPMRIGNLVQLRLGRHLKYGDTRRGCITHIVLQAHETKNNSDLEWWVSPEHAAFLDRYIKQFRPVLAPAGNDWLFPAGFQGDGPLSDCAMFQSINQIIAEKVGAVVNPHLFRSLCARMILEHSPGALEDVRLMLGNKTLEVILAHYSPVERVTAGRRADDVLRRARDEVAYLTAPLAMPRKRSRR